MTIRCPRCGTLSPAGVRFCPNCGQQNQSAQFIPDNPPSNPQNSGNMAGPASFPPIAPAPLAAPPAMGGQAAAGVPSVAGTPSLPTPAGMGTPHGQLSAGSSVPSHFPASPNAQGMAHLGPQAPQAPQSAHFPGSPNSQGMARMGTPQAQPMANAPAHAPTPPHFPAPPASHVAPPAGHSVAGAIGKALKPGSAARLAAYIKHTTAAKLILGAAAVLIIGVPAFAYYQYQQYRATAPTTFVIGTDRGNAQIVRVDLATRNQTVLLSNKVLPGAPDSAVFINDTQMLINFPGNGEIGIGDIQNNTYKSITKLNNTTLRDMALRPDGSGVLISDSNGTILEYHMSDQSVKPFVQNIGGVQGLAFGPDGALYAAVGGQVIQLDPTSGKQIKTFPLPGGSDGMAYDPHRNTLDIASGSGIIALDPTKGSAGSISTLIDGVGTTDGVAIDRHGNLFIASTIGILELTLDNQLLIVGTDSNGVTWDDVAPLSGSGAANY